MYAFPYSDGTLPTFKQSVKMEARNVISLSDPNFKYSLKIRSEPGALLIFNFFKVALTSWGMITPSRCGSLLGTAVSGNEGGGYFL